MKFKYVEQAYKAVIAGALALGVITALSSYAAGPAEPVAAPSPTPTIMPR